MSQKLTLTVQPDIIEKAKVYAKQKGRSLSDIIESYLRLLVIDDTNKDNVSPITKSLKGCFSDQGFSDDYKKEIQEARYKKYMKK